MMLKLPAGSAMHWSHMGHGFRAYVCVAYAPPINNCTYANGEKVFLNAILPGLQRATNYKGPALIYW